MGSSRKFANAAFEVVLESAIETYGTAPRLFFYSNATITDADKSPTFITVHTTKPIGVVLGRRTVVPNAEKLDKSLYRIAISLNDDVIGSNVQFFNLNSFLFHG
ncbi:hypothetical protein Zmor_005663 [Zophobas morio]|uniref:Uncharacterized protein n=1 Tax=Zophobas morio TaxID=2755281 RepID=A0AA38IY22_9CUCU|nr:hypothetical protein Zmor_005663 [Zophobas morio]